MLYRNPICRLYPDDVCFIQPPDGYADFTTKVIHLINLNIEGQEAKSCKLQRLNFTGEQFNVFFPPQQPDFDVHIIKVNLHSLNTNS